VENLGDLGPANGKSDFPEDFQRGLRGWCVAVADESAPKIFHRLS
jgi:hypothetical protein